MRGSPFGTQGPLQKRTRDTTSIFHGFDIDFGRQFGDILKVLVPKMIILTCILQQFLLEFFCIHSKHNPKEVLTSRFLFSKARCGNIAVGNWDPHRAAVRPRRVGIGDRCAPSPST